MIISEEVKKWLLDSNPWTEYNTRIELLNQDFNSSEVVDAKKRMINHPLIQELIAELEEWPGYPLKRHNDAKHLYHKLAFLTQIGLTKDDHPIFTKIAKKIFKDQSEEGAFQLIANIPTHFGGTGKDELVWMLCDAPTVLYSMIKLGYGDDKRIEKAINHLAGLIRENGWPCASTPTLGKFKGPGRREDPCPYANLIALKVFTEVKNDKYKDVCKIGSETLLNLWTLRKEKKPFLFAMGTRFRKLKVPMIWYDVLHVSNVLLSFKWLRNDNRLLEMIEIIKEKSNGNGQFKAESVWRAYKEWDFGHKREPSPWLTYTVYQTLKKIKK